MYDQTPLLSNSNPEQLRAVTLPSESALILAGAGSGKTRVLTTRIAWLLQTSQVGSGAVLAVTFTNKAAREMRERVGQLIGPTVEGMPWLGTFHSICVKLLRRHAELVGLKSNFTILDTDDQIRLLKQLIAVSNIDDKRWPARMLAGIIDNWKNRAWTPDKVPAAEAGAYNNRGTELYEAYQIRLRELRLVGDGGHARHGAGGEVATRRLHAALGCDRRTDHRALCVSQARLRHAARFHRAHHADRHALPVVARRGAAARRGGVRGSGCARERARRTTR